MTGHKPFDEIRRTPKPITHIDRVVRDIRASIARQDSSTVRRVALDEHTALGICYILLEYQELKTKYADLQDRFDHLESEWTYDRDRGDHTIYRDEWEAFDRWQREHRPVVPYSQRDKSGS